MFCNACALCIRCCRIRLCRALQFDYKQQLQSFWHCLFVAQLLVGFAVILFCSLPDMCVASCPILNSSFLPRTLHMEASLTHNSTQQIVFCIPPHELVCFAHDGQSIYGNNYVRIGEASHPGPFVISTFNPTQLLGHEDEISLWNKGIWTGCETSHTQEAMMISKTRFHKKDVFSKFSSPVGKHSSNAGTLRGKASGTVVLSTFPLKPYPGNLPAAVDQASRFVDALVHLGNGTHIYVGTVYGPPTANVTLSNGEEVFLEAALTGIDRATKFKGPAVITGDFNRNLEDVAFWPFLQQQGWHDAAILAWHRFGTFPENTCKDVSRKSFVLINGELAKTLTACHVTHKFHFDSHPVLEAVFDLDACIKPKMMWSLPRSFDSFLFDEKLIEDAAFHHIQERSKLFENAIEREDLDEALKQFAMTFESIAADASVDVEGNRTRLPRSAFKRCRNKLHKFKPKSAPCIKHGREGDDEVLVCQPTAEISRFVKQLRRIRSLHRQVVACNLDRNERNLHACEHLWFVILTANGFSGGFAFWVNQQFGMFVPSQLPHCEYIAALLAEFQFFYRGVETHFRSEQNLRRRGTILEDITKGGSLSYQEIRDRAPPPLAFLQESVKACVIPQRWSKQGNSIILVDANPGFQVGLPVEFQQQCAIIEKIDSNKIFLDRKVKCKKLQGVLTQQRSTSDPAQMHLLVDKAWSPMWSRDDPNDTHEQWPDCVEIITSLADCESCPYQSFDLDMWKKYLKGINMKSSRGACGFSSRDLTLFPPSLLEWLFRIFRCAEEGCGWPQRLTQARVIMLSKPNSDNYDALSVRPITVLSRLYRQWSRCRSIQVLKHLGSQLPPEIGGIASNVSADLLVAWIADQIDEGLHSNTSFAGVVVDLTKAFNMLPRIPLSMLAAKLGLPQEYAFAHNAMLHDLVRFVDLGGHIGHGIPSTTGVPEGCAMSVVSMLLITILVSQSLQADNFPVILAMFADNWGITTHNVDQLQFAIGRLEHVIESLKLKISADKSWTWATTPNLRKQLHQIEIFDEPVPSVLNTKDLGCDVAYSKKVVKTTAKKRWQKSLRHLKKIKNKKLPYRFKGQMTNAVGVGMIGYGIEVGTQSKWQWKKLRAGIANALKCHKSGANSLLTLSASGEHIDPELRCLIRRIKFFRRYFRIFPNRQSYFVQACGRAVHKAKVSPSYAFQFAFRSAGWNVRTDGSITHACGLQFDWVVDSIRHIKFCLRFAWNHDVAKQVAHRPHFDIDNFYSHWTLESLKHRSPKHQGVIRAIVSGRHHTNDALCKFAQDVSDDKCNLCNCKDSKFHRVFECEKLSDIRKRFRKAINWVKRQCEAVFAFGLFPADCDIFLSKVRANSVVCEKVIPPDGPHSHIFTDGTAFHNGDWVHCLAGGAAIEVDWKTSNWQLLSRSILQGGDHSSFRGESFAILLALQKRRKLTLYVDCAAVVDLLHQIVNCQLTLEPLPVFSSPDIWNVIAWHIMQRKKGDVAVVKIEAHQNWEALPKGKQRQTGFFSDMVDSQAKDSIRVDQKKLYSKINAAIERDRVNKEHLFQFHDFLCAANDRCFEHKPQNPGVAQSKPVFCEVLSGSQPFFHTVALEDCSAGTCPFGDVFFNRFRNWWNSLVWGSGPPTSLLELYFDFAISTQTQVPVVVGYRKYHLRDKSTLADVQESSLLTQSKTWIHFIKWLQKHYVDYMPCPIQSKLRALHPFGYSIPCLGFPLRVQWHAGVIAADALWLYFHQGDKIKRSLASPWSPHVK